MGLPGAAVHRRAADPARDRARLPPARRRQPAARRPGGGARRRFLEDRFEGLLVGIGQLVPGRPADDGDQRVGDVRADEARPAGYEYLHVRHVPVSEIRRGCPASLRL